MYYLSILRALWGTTTMHEDDPICIGIRFYQPRKLSELHSALILVRKSAIQRKVYLIIFFGTGLYLTSAFDATNLRTH